MQPSCCRDDFVPEPRNPPPARQVGITSADSEQSSRTVLFRASFVALYVGVLSWFGIVDIYHQHYFQAGPLYLGYTLVRILFIGYLGWLHFFLGQRLMRCWQARCPSLKLKLLDELILCFYLGGGILTASTFLLGLLNLYYYWLFFCLTLSLILLSSAEFVSKARVWSRMATRILLQDRVQQRRHLSWLVLSCIVILAGVLLLVKGLYPGGAGDYYVHYAPYFRRVLQSHGLWPNDVWYHFYVSKGATITICSMLLTDLQSSELVTYLYFIVATLCVYSLLRRCANNRFIPALGMAASISGFICTRHWLYYEWAHFQKHHEITGSLLLSLVWLTVVARNGTGVERKVWLSFLALFAGHCVLFQPTVFPFVFAVLGLVAGLALLKCYWGLLAGAATGMLSASVVFGGLLTLNYCCTGLAEVTPMRMFWKYADQQRFSRWVSPYLMVLLLEGSSPEMGNVHFVDDKELLLPRVEFLRMLARTHVIRPFFPDVDMTAPPCLLLVSLVVGFRLLRGRKVRFEAWRFVVPVLGLFFFSLAISQLIPQPGSVFRYFSFLVFLIVMLALGLWSLFFHLNPNRKLVLVTSYVLPAILTCLVTCQSLIALPRDDRKNALCFAIGLRSLADGFGTRLVTSSVPVEIRKVVGREPRIYSFNPLTFSMAPDCELESFLSFGLHQHWHTILFESPERARAVLRQQGLNYFLIDLDGAGLEILQYSPLFQPGNIQRFLGVCCQIGNAYLLTWSGVTTKPIPNDFLVRYSKATPPGQFSMRPLYDRLRTIYELNKPDAYPLYHPSLPRVLGWQ